GHRHSRFQSRDRTKNAKRPVLRLRRRLTIDHAQRRPYLKGGVRKAEPRRRHADDGECPAAQIDCFSNDLRIAGEPSLPESIAEDDRVLSIILRSEIAPEERLNAEDRKEVAAHLATHDLLRVDADPKVVHV